MFNLYKVSLRLGKRTIVLNLYSRSLADVQTFCSRNLVAEIKSIYKVEFEASSGKVYPIDDPATYKNTAKFNVRSSAEKVALVIDLQTIKLTRSYTQVFDDIALYLGSSPSTGIDAYTAITESGK